MNKYKRFNYVGRSCDRELHKAIMRCFEKHEADIKQAEEWDKHAHTFHSAMLWLTLNHPELVRTPEQIQEIKDKFNKSIGRYSLGGRIWGPLKRNLVALFKRRTK